MWSEIISDLNFEAQVGRTGHIWRKSECEKKKKPGVQGTQCINSNCEVPLEHPLQCMRSSRCASLAVMEKGFVTSESFYKLRSLLRKRKQPEIKSRYNNECLILVQNLKE